MVFLYAFVLVQTQFCLLNFVLFNIKCRLKFLITNRHTRAQVIHNSGVVLVSASTTEFEITKHLYKTTDVSAALNVGRVVAQRCLEAGIMHVRWEVQKGDLRKQRVMSISV